MNKKELINLRSYLKDNTTLYLPYNYKEKEETDKKQAKCAKEFLSKTVNGVLSLKKIMKKNLKNFGANEIEEITFNLSLSRIVSVNSIDEENNVKEDYNTLSDCMEILVTTCIKKDNETIELDLFESYDVFYVASFKNFVVELSNLGINIEGINEETLDDILFSGKQKSPYIVIDMKQNIKNK